MKTNLGFESEICPENAYYREARDGVFDIFGLLCPRKLDHYRRVPEDVAAATSTSVAALSSNTAGGRLRFSTDSEYIAIYAEMPSMADMSHFARTGSSAFDIYVKCGAKYVYHDTFMPTLGDHYEAISRFKVPGMKDVMLHFPTYSDVKNLYIGVAEGSRIEHSAPYRYLKPVVYYGSSITQGACASRPGNAYEAIISNDLDCDFINLGFSGSALAEEAITDYINSLDMSVFVMDYDHNAPNPGHLERTHEAFFKKIRASHPDLPVIMISRPTFEEGYGGPHAYGISVIPPENEMLRCREVVFRTYMNAVNAGDRSVYFIDGASLFNGPHADLCTVDGVHPNDAGFLRMADRIGSFVSAALPEDPA